MFRLLRRVDALFFKFIDLDYEEFTLAYKMR
jgi:hypothetical protein